MMNAAAFGQLIILVVYLPILSLQGIEGKMFRPMAETVSFSIIGALILSVTYVPMISALLLSKKIKRADTFSDRWMNTLSIWYKNTLQKILTIPKT
ncbi:efflux RND transporter permease subunit, partial [Streptomyces galilaeus]|uniref:efflux RND transporter permease subunit n=1 Tax=Streptomyces galilaeus TaxID=33899 RepID=UPI0038F7D328